MKVDGALRNCVSLFLVFFFQLNLFAQEVEVFNADSLFLVAHEQAVAGNYQGAVNMANRILNKYPDYSDAVMLKARAYAWSRKYDEALAVTDSLLNDNPNNLDAILAKCDFYLWSGKPDLADETVNNGLNLLPYNESLLIKKAQIELELENYDETSKVTELIHERYPDNQQASEIDGLISMRNWRDELRFEHYFDAFDKPYSRRWHMSSIGYGRKTKAGVFYGKVYFGDLVRTGEKLYQADVAKQYSLEFYPRINKNNYFFLNYSYSPDFLFPRNRLGVEYYHVLRNKLELSAGYRYMQFADEISSDTKIHIFTGSLAKYVGNWWISARSYVIDDGQDLAYKYTLDIRKYFDPEISYIELSGGTGTSPENPAFYTGGAQQATLDSWRVGVEWKQRVSGMLSLEMEAGYENTEYIRGERRDQLILRTALSFLF